MSERCPFCGSIPDPSDPEYYYHCGTARGTVPFKKRTKYCYTSEIAVLKAKLADRETRLEAWREGKDYFSWSPFKRIQWRNKLKFLGEI